MLKPSFALLALLLTVSIAGCGDKKGRLISIDSQKIGNVMQTSFTIADATSIRKSGSRSTINYQVSYESAGIEAQKAEFIAKRGYDGFTPLTGFRGTTEFNCDAAEYADLDGQYQYADGRTAPMKLEQGKVLPNSKIEKLMSYACMSSLWRPVFDFWHGSSSPI